MGAIEVQLNSSRCKTRALSLIRILVYQWLWGKIHLNTMTSTMAKCPRSHQDRDLLRALKDLIRSHIIRHHTTPLISSMEFHLLTNLIGVAGIRTHQRRYQMARTDGVQWLGLRTTQALVWVTLRRLHFQARVRTVMEV